MPAVARCTQDRIATGHSCSATAGIAGVNVPTVIVNNKPIAVRGDSIAPHTIKAGRVCVPHGAQINAGSPTVYAGNIPVGRIGDSADAGAIISGSSNVFAN